MRKKKVVLRSEVRRSSNDATTLQIRNNVNYKECQRNHVANTGGYAVDGCREFIPGGDEGTSLALVCAACGCHRNFHRREMDSEAVSESSYASSSRERS